MNDASAYMVKVTRVCEVQSARVHNSETANAYWNDVIARQPWFDAEKEHVVALMLDTQCAVQGFSLISIGTVSETCAHPREVFRAAVASSAYAIVMMHNHPSGSASPSDADIALTDKLQACGDVLCIPLFDHVIVAGDTSYSFKENGRL
jgi:DNA repair protein RadC